MPIYENGRSIPRIGRGHSRASRVVVILQAAVDESGTHDSSEHYVLGGYVASEDQWAKFEPAWDAMLSRVGVTYFHGTELKSGKKRCAGLPARLRAALAENAEDIANHYLGFRFAIWLRKADFRQIDFRLRAAKCHDGIYGLLFRSLLSSVPLLAKRHYSDIHAIYFIAEAGCPSGNGAFQVFNQIKREIPILGSMSQGGKDILALQVADFMAFAAMIEANRDNIDWSENRNPTNLAPHSPEDGFPTFRMRLDRDALEKIVSQIEVRKIARQNHYRASSTPKRE